MFFRRLSILLLLMSLSASGCGALKSVTGFGGTADEPNKAAESPKTGQASGQAPGQAPGAAKAPLEGAAEHTPRPAGPGEDGDIDYKNLAGLKAAAEDAITKGTFVGHADPFDAFPELPGDDSAASVFVIPGRPEVRVRYFTFYAPGKPFHGRVYGYIVHDEGRDKAFGHFDSKGDGVFDLRTTNPKLDFGAWERPAGKP